MSIIEQAARRLEELRRSGIEVPMPAGLAATPTATEAAGARALRVLDDAAVEKYIEDNREAVEKAARGSTPPASSR